MDVQEKQIQFVNEQIHNADILFPAILKIIGQKKCGKRMVLSISGGSGVGKTGMAYLIKERFGKQGINAIVISGDSYPHRIPVYNDAERLRIFRTAGLLALLEKKLYSRQVSIFLRDLQMQGKDADENLITENPWIAVYQRAGDKALKHYLGTEKEVALEELSAVLCAYKGGADQIMLRHMGRKEHEIWYEETDVSDKNMLILEWTHGNSSSLEGIDISVVLVSSPKETLENRKKRNRDAAVDSQFVARVLQIEQEKINASLHCADLLQNMQGCILNG